MRMHGDTLHICSGLCVHLNYVHPPNANAYITNYYTEFMWKAKSPLATKFPLVIHNILLV